MMKGRGINRGNRSRGKTYRNIDDESRTMRVVYQGRLRRFVPIRMSG